MDKNDLQERMINFAVRIIKMVDFLLFALLRWLIQCLIAFLVWP